MQKKNTKKPYVSIIIPTKNEEANIGILIKEIEKILLDYGHEIVIVDGMSTDKTVEIAKRLGARILYDKIGKGSALIKGLKSSRGSILISMDADLSHKPDEIKLLMDSIEIGYDIAMGSRFITGGGSEDMPQLRVFGNKVFVSIVNLLFHSHYSDMCYGYRSFRKGVPERLGLKEKGFGIETEISIKAARKKLKVIEIPSNEKRRNAGDAKLRTFHDGYVILKTIMRNLASR